MNADLVPSSLAACALDNGGERAGDGGKSMSRVATGSDGRGFPRWLEFGVRIEFAVSRVCVLRGGSEAERTRHILVKVVTGGGGE